MKIAVCISGGMKFPEKSLQSLSCIFPNDDVKVFIHTWYIPDEDSYKDSCYSYTNPSGSYHTTNDIRFDILSQFNYSKLLIENYDEKKPRFENLFNALKFSSYIRHDIGPISMWYSISKCVQLKTSYELENQITFDRVIRMRFDSDFQDKILDLTDINEELYIPSGRDWGKINDQFVMGSSRAVDRYADLYNQIHHLVNVEYCSENMLLEHISREHLNVTKFDFKIDINNSQGPQESWI